MEEGACKKHFADIMTDFISSEKIFNDTNMEFVARFQYLVIKLYNKAIAYYRYYLQKKYGKLYSQTDIFFSYKGGTTMKIVFELYKGIFETLNSYQEISEKFKKPRQVLAT